MCGPISKMKYDQIVVGLGPTGIAYALELERARQPYALELERARQQRVLFLEADERLGGCWKSHWDGPFFREHSPKVLFRYGSPYFQSLLRRLEVSPRFRKVYAKNPTVSMMRPIFDGLSSMDLVRLLVYVVLLVIGQKDSSTTVEEWMDSHHITTSGKAFLSKLCLLVSNIPSKIRMNVFARLFVSFAMFLSVDQMERPDEWLDVAHGRLASNPEFDVRFRTKVTHIETLGTNATAVHTNHGERFEADRFVFCVPLRQMERVIERSSLRVRANWFGSFEILHAFVEASTYAGIGFSLHFADPVVFPQEWYWSGDGAWRVIVVDKTNTLGTYTRDPSIRRVWSCVIVDMDSKSDCLGATVHECADMGVVVSEAIRQLREQYRKRLGFEFPSPYHVSMPHNVARIDGAWRPWESSYSNAAGTMPARGSTVSNLFSIGPHNLGEITVIDSAIRSALVFATHSNV